MRTLPAGEVFALLGILGRLFAKYWFRQLQAAEKRNGK
jgi:hypothetical protein